jgi:hypothetical protein
MDGYLRRMDMEFGVYMGRLPPFYDTLRTGMKDDLASSAE